MARLVRTRLPVVALLSTKMSVPLGRGLDDAEGTAALEEGDVAKSPRKARRRLRLTAGVEASMRPSSGASDVSAPVIAIDMSSAASITRRNLYAVALGHELHISTQHAVAANRFDAVQDDLVDGSDFSWVFSPPRRCRSRRRRLTAVEVAVHARAVDPDSRGARCAARTTRRGRCRRAWCGVEPSRADRWRRRSGST